VSDLGPQRLARQPRRTGNRRLTARPGPSSKWQGHGGRPGLRKEAVRLLPIDRRRVRWTVYSVSPCAGCDVLRSRRGDMEHRPTGAVNTAPNTSVDQLPRSPIWTV